MAYFSKVSRDASPRPQFGARLVSITVRLVVSNMQGEIWFTDLILQAGSIASGWVGNVTEMKWTLDG